MSKANEGRGGRDTTEAISKYLAITGTSSKIRGAPAQWGVGGSKNNDNNNKEKKRSRTTESAVHLSWVKRIL
jgi:hypothetical protein